MTLNVMIVKTNTKKKDKEKIQKLLKKQWQNGIKLKVKNGERNMKAFICSLFGLKLHSTSNNIKGNKSSGTRDGNKVDFRS
mgnify:CR=1 FL=1